MSEIDNMEYEGKRRLLEEFCTALKIDKERDLFIVDPLMIHLPDLKAVGIKNIVRVRRDGWGKGDVGNFFRQISYEDLKSALEETSDEGNE